MADSAATSAASSAAIPAISPATSNPLTTTGALVVTTSPPSLRPTAPRPVFTPEEMIGYIVDLSHSVNQLQDMMRAFVGGQYVVQPPQPSRRRVQGG
jgi:hypothetical protein